MLIGEVARLRRIFQVEALRTLGLSLLEVARALEVPGFAPAALVGDLIRRTEEQLDRQRELLDRLRAVGDSEPSAWPDVLRILELLHGLGSPDAAPRQRAVLAPADDLPVPTGLLATSVLAAADPNVAGALRWALARVGGDAVASVAAGGCVRTTSRCAGARSWRSPSCRTTGRPPCWWSPRGS